MGRAKVAKDPAKPKGRMSAYAFFVQTCREEHRQKHPNETVEFAQFSRKCADRWKGMVDKEKKKFQDYAEEDKARYNRQMEGYKPPKGSEAAKKGAKRKKKDPNAPKRNLSGFFLFSNDTRGEVKAANPDFQVGSIAKVLGERWKNISAAEKAKYDKAAAEDKVRYQKEMAEYKAEKSSESESESD